MAGVLECVALSKAFSGIDVLKGVSLSLEHGTVTALAGENGAELHTGSIAEAHRTGVAILPQELASIPDKTGLPEPVRRHGEAAHRGAGSPPDSNRGPGGARRRRRLRDRENAVAPGRSK